MAQTDTLVHDVQIVKAFLSRLNRHLGEKIRANALSQTVRGEIIDLQEIIISMVEALPSVTMPVEKEPEKLPLMSISSSRCGEGDTKDGMPGSNLGIKSHEQQQNGDKFLELLDEYEHQSALLKAMFEAESAGIAVLVGENLQFAFVNPSYRYLTPNPALNPVGKTYAEIWPDNVGKIDPEGYTQVINTGVPFHERGIEYRVASGSLRTFSVQVRRISWESEAAVLVLVWDITEQTRSKQALSTSEARFRAIFEGAAIGIALVDVATGQPVAVNRSLQQILGYTEAELKSMPFFQFTHPDDLELEDPLFQELIDGTRESYQLEKRFLPKMGPPIWCNLIVSLVKDRTSRPYGIGMVEDITERKRLEEQLRADTTRLEIQRRLLEQREQERLIIARDLHDGPVQALTGTAFVVQGLLQTSQDPAMTEGLTNIRNSLQQQIADLREYAGELRPPALARFGLIKGIRDHLDIYQEKHPDITVQFSPDDGSTEFTPEQQSLALYRIYQEIMTNIGKHSQASQVQIFLRQDIHQIQLEVVDNGIGFSVPTDWMDYIHQGHLGLAGMRERAEAVGGILEVFSNPGRGTLIRATLPIDQPEKRLNFVEKWGGG